MLSRTAKSCSAGLRTPPCACISTAAATVCRQKAQNKGKTSEEVDSGDLKGCVAHFQACGWDASDFDDRSAEGGVFRNELGKPSPLGRCRPGPAGLAVYHIQQLA